MSKMSKEKLLAFAEAVSKSSELQKRLAVIQAQAARSTAESLAKLSENAGTPFTVQEYLQAVAQTSDEMSETQLRGVAGGVWEPSRGNLMLSIFTIGLGCAVMATVSEGMGKLDSCQFKDDPPDKSQYK